MSGRGTVFKHRWKDGRRTSWRISYQLPNGRRKVETVGPSKREAERVLAERLADLRSGGYRELTEATFEGFGHKWLSDYALPHTKPSTYDGYRRYLENHWIPRFGSWRLQAITTADIEAAVAELSARGLAPKSVNNFVVPLKRMLAHAVRWGYLRDNPAAGVERLRVPQREMRALTPAEVRRLLDAVAPEHRLLVELAVMTGVRRGELFALRWGDVDIRTARLHVRRAVWQGQYVAPKSERSRRAVDLAPALVERLREARPQGSDEEIAGRLLFPGAGGGPLDPTSFLRRHFTPALERAGLSGLRFHDLRHTYASLLILAGEHPKYLQAQLGHASITTTLDRYSHLLPGEHAHGGDRLQAVVWGER
ncbi:MAG: site-specific integrase [Actinobacteria bacterium]|nr:site-specific integrase [Actinomycetota bacterium]